MKKTKEWLILNAVKAWLHNYDDGTQDELTPQYQELNKELENEQSKDTTSKKRGRPAKRQRTKKTSSIEASQEESKTT